MKQEVANDMLDTLAKAFVKSEIPLDLAVATFKKRLLGQYLKVHHGNICHTAKAIGVHRNTLTRFFDAHGINASEYR